MGEWIDVFAGKKRERRAEGTDRWVEEDHVKEREGVGTWRRSDMLLKDVGTGAG